MDRALAAAASRLGVSVTLPELERDIDAQLAALADPDHIKNAVFLARGNYIGDRKIPAHIFIERRAEGTLLTTNATLAHEFRSCDYITDEMIAAILGYPEAKADIMMRDDVTVIQTLDSCGCVIFECATSDDKLLDTIQVAEMQKPKGGCVVRISVIEAITRRQQEMN